LNEYYNLLNFKKYLLILIFIIYILTQISLILIDNFHYTIDIQIAIIFVILLWNNKYIDNISLSFIYDYYAFYINNSYNSLIEYNDV
jgi:hypothetical protein